MIVSKSGVKPYSPKRLRHTKYKTIFIFDFGKSKRIAWPSELSSITRLLSVLESKSDAVNQLLPRISHVAPRWSRWLSEITLISNPSFVQFAFNGYTYATLFWIIACYATASSMTLARTSGEIGCNRGDVANRSSLTHPIPPVAKSIVANRARYLTTAIIIYFHRSWLAERVHTAECKQNFV